MAAIMPHLEEQHDPSETRDERLVHGQDGRAQHVTTQNLSGIEADPANSESYLDAEDRATQVAHSELIQTTWVRRAVQEQLEGSTVRAEVQYTDAAGKNVRPYVAIVLDHSFGEGPLFNRFPPNIRNGNKVSLLGWTSKMGCPSYSLPAGPPIFGGACPGSVAGVSISDPEHFVAAGNLVRRITKEPVELAKATCEFCYALGGNYRYGSKQLASTVLYEWTKRAVEDGSFVEVLDWAMKNSDFGEAAYREKGVQIPAEHRGKFFRIHDAGDYFSRKYLEAWKQVADRNPDIMFWSPTRIWATSWGIEAVNRVNDPPNNLIIRPSTYMVNRPVPPVAELGPGWAAWTTVYGKKIKPTEGPRIEGGMPYDWDCQTYATAEKGHTCRAALAPDGHTGCRACWLHTDLSVNYTLH